MTITKAKIALAAVAAGMTTAIVIQSQNNARLQQENGALRQEAARADELRAENERLSRANAAAAPGLNQNQLRELLRLRAEVGALKEQLKNVPKPVAEAKVDAPKEAPAEEASEPLQKIAIAKMNFTKQWMLAFILYGSEHQNACPTNFAQATGYFPNGEPEGVSTNQFQILYQGAFNAITNPGQTIVVGELEPTQWPDGGWSKTYGFADGHAEIHKEPDGNFTPWESSHTQMPPGQ
jgi:hypothetical protein